MSQFIAAKPKGSGPTPPGPIPARAPFPPNEGAREATDGLPPQPTPQAVRRTSHDPIDENWARSHAEYERKTRKLRANDIQVLEQMLEYLERVPRRKARRILKLLERML
jgi:hypothetical protein